MSSLSSDAFLYEQSAAITGNHDRGDEDGGTTLRSVSPAPVHTQMSRDYGGGPVKMPRAIFYADGV